MLREEIRNNKFLLKHSQEWTEKYPGKCVAIVGNKLAAVGRDRIEEYQKAKKRYPKEQNLL